MHLMLQLSWELKVKQPVDGFEGVGVLAQLFIGPAPREISARVNAVTASNVPRVAHIAVRPTFSVIKYAVNRKPQSTDRA
jgi:acetamidase/formamidase